MVAFRKLCEKQESQEGINKKKDTRKMVMKIVRKRCKQENPKGCFSDTVCRTLFSCDVICLICSLGGWGREDRTVYLLVSLTLEECLNPQP